MTYRKLISMCLLLCMTMSSTQALGQIHSFSSSYDGTKIGMSNWDIKAALGFTF